MLNFLPSLFGAASSFLPQQGASMMNDPSVQAGFGSIDQTLAGMQGVADQFVNPAGQRGQSPAYMQGLTGGGTGAQNDRFSRMYDPSNVTADALASLAADPQFGHLFGGGPQASVQQFQAPQQAIPQITDDTISAMRNQGQLDGTSGVRLSPQLQSQALQNRLDQRADSAAALENMRVGPMDFVNPLDRMAAAYEWEAMNREFQAQQEKNLLAKTLAQAEIDARNAATTEQSRQFDVGMDFKKLQAMLQGQATSAQSLFTQGIERQKIELLERELAIQEAAARNEQANRLPYNADDVSLRGNLQKEHGSLWPQKYKEHTGVWPKGVPDPLGGGMDSYGGTVYSPSTPGAASGGQYSLQTRTSMTLPEGMQATPFLEDPWGNYEDYYAHAVPDQWKDKFGSKYGNAGFFGGGMFNNEPLQKLDADMAQLRNPDGTPLNEAQKSAIRRHFFGWGSAGDAISGLPVGGAIGAGLFSGNSFGPDYASLYYDTLDPLAPKPQTQPGAIQMFPPVTAF